MATLEALASVAGILRQPHFRSRGSANGQHLPRRRVPVEPSLTTIPTSASPTPLANAAHHLAQHHADALLLSLYAGITMLHCG